MAGVQRDLHNLRSLTNAPLLHCDRKDRLPTHFETDGNSKELVTLIETLAYVKFVNMLYLIGKPFLSHAFSLINLRFLCLLVVNPTTWSGC